MVYYLDLKREVLIINELQTKTSSLRFVAYSSIFICYNFFSVEMNQKSSELQVMVWIEEEREDGSHFVCLET